MKYIVFILLLITLSIYSIDTSHNGHNNLDYELKLLNDATDNFDQFNNKIFNHHHHHHHHHHHQHPRERIYIKTVTKKEEIKPILPTPTSAGNAKAITPKPTVAPKGKSNTPTVTPTPTTKTLISDDLKNTAVDRVADALQDADLTNLVFVSEGKKRTNVGTVDIKVEPSKKNSTNPNEDKVNVKLFFGSVLNKDPKNGCGRGTYYCSIKKQCIACPHGTTSHRGSTKCFSTKKSHAKRYPSVTITTIQDKIQYPKKANHDHHDQSRGDSSLMFSENSKSDRLPSEAKDILNELNKDFLSKDFFNVPKPQNEMKSFFNIPALKVSKKQKSPRVSASVVFVAPKAPIVSIAKEVIHPQVALPKTDAPKGKSTESPKVNLISNSKIAGSSNTDFTAQNKIGHKKGRKAHKTDFIVVNCGNGFYFHPNRTCQPCPKGTVSGPNPTACTAI